MRLLISHSFFRYRLITIIEVIILTLVIICSGCSKAGLSDDSTIQNIENEPVLLAPNGDYKHQLFDDYRILCYGVNTTLYCKEDIILGGKFYKYSYIPSKFFAAHKMELTDANDDCNDEVIKFAMDNMKLIKSSFVLYDIEKTELIEFENIEKFNKYCNEKGISFDSWYYREAKSIRKPISEKCYIEDIGKSRGQQLYLNNKPLFEGIIEGINVIDNSHITFKLQVVDFDYGPEFLESNNNLNFDSYASSKKYRDGLFFYDIKYSAYILLNTDTGEYFESNDAWV